jgi:hypothetical protein
VAQLVKSGDARGDLGQRLRGRAFRCVHGDGFSSRSAVVQEHRRYRSKTLLGIVACYEMTAAWGVWTRIHALYVCYRT